VTALKPFYYKYVNATPKPLFCAPDGCAFEQLSVARRMAHFLYGSSTSSGVRGSCFEGDFSVYEVEGMVVSCCGAARSAAAPQQSRNKRLGGAVNLIRVGLPAALLIEACAS
jgi:hypothetical protein